MNDEDEAYWAWQIRGLQDDVSPTSKGEETRECQSRRAAKLDMDGDFTPTSIAGAFQRDGYCVMTSMSL